VPRRILLDIDDDTKDRVHGGQQLSLFHAHYDSRGFLPIHYYEATTGKPVAMILRPGKTPDGTEVAMVLRQVAGLAEQAAMATSATPPVAGRRSNARSSPVSKPRPKAPVHASSVTNLSGMERRPVQHHPARPDQGRPAVRLSLQGKLGPACRPNRQAAAPTSGAACPSNQSLPTPKPHTSRL